MDRFYEDDDSLFVRAYDAFYIGGYHWADIGFYERLARATGGPVLELACGTGRIALARADAGLEITGVDISEGMLSVARRKAAARPASVQQRLTLVQQDMSELNLGRRFGFAFVPARSFQHLLTVGLQTNALEAIRRHLQPAGRLSVRSSSRLPDRPEHRMAGTLGHPSRDRVPLYGRGVPNQFRSPQPASPRFLALHRNRTRWRGARARHARDGAALDLSMGAASSAPTMWLRG